MDDFENGMVKMGGGRAVHLIHPSPARIDGGPRLWCRPGYINMPERAEPVADDAKVTCKNCLALKAETP